MVSYEICKYVIKCDFNFMQLWASNVWYVILMILYAMSLQGFLSCIATQSSSIKE